MEKGEGFRHYFQILFKSDQIMSAKGFRKIMIEFIQYFGPINVSKITAICIIPQVSILVLI